MMAHHKIYYLWFVEYITNTRPDFIAKKSKNALKRMEKKLQIVTIARVSAYSPA
jgi:hypothetical protein